jgi:hypothetical protein
MSSHFYVNRLVLLPPPKKWVARIKFTYIPPSLPKYVLLFIFKCMTRMTTTTRNDSFRQTQFDPKIISYLTFLRRYVLFILFKRKILSELTKVRNNSFAQTQFWPTDDDSKKRFFPPDSIWFVSWFFSSLRVSSLWMKQSTLEVCTT